MQNPNIPYLLIPGSSEERIAFERPVLTIGSASFTDICIPDHEISRRHCRFYRVGNTFWVQDWYSSNGILYNGERVRGIQGLLAGEGVSHAVVVGGYDVHVECPASFSGDPRHDLAAIREWFDTLVNDFPDYQRQFWSWADAMGAEA